VTDTTPAPLALRLERTSRDTLPVQLAGQMRALVTQGVLGPGQRLPSSRSLAADLGVARTVVETAFDQLVAEGWLVTRRGAGTFVGAVGGASSQPRPEVRSSPRAPSRERELVSFDTGTPYVDPRLEAGWRRAWREAAHARIPRGYPDPAGIEELRELVAAYVARRRGVICTADEVLVTAGTTHGLAVVLDRIGRGTVAIEDPGYRAAVEVAHSARFEVADIPVDDGGICVEALTACSADLKAVYVTPAHQHPTAVTMTAARRVALVAEARRRGAWIVEDDYDSEFRYDVAPLPALASLSRDVIYLGTAAKAVHPALRIGWLVGPSDLVADLATQRARRHDHPSWPVQRAFLAMLRDGHVDRLIRSARRVYAERGELVRRRLAPFAPVLGAGAGMYVTVPLTPSVAESVVAAARRAGLEVPRLAAYGRTERRDGLVLGFGGVTHAELEHCLDVVTAALAGGRGVA